MKARHLWAVLAMLCVPGLGVAGTTVQLAAGTVQGAAEDDGFPVVHYLGLPFAAPPLGALRWRAPQPVESWKGVRMATDFAPACAQTGNFYASDDEATFGAVFGDEDCLYLNIWRPASPAVEPRPVLVFVHGGAGVAGSASLPAYNGRRLAYELDAVVVTIQYRLGVFGGVYLSALQSGDALDDSGAFGLLDQIAALHWIQDNIAAFGGDADAVTLMGHSAGAVSLWSLMRSPLAEGLFDRAVSLSGIPMSHNRKDVAERGEVFAQKLQDAGLSPQTAADYRALDTAQVLAAGQGLKSLGQFADGTVLPLDDNRDGALINAVPTLIANVANEASMLLFLRYSRVDRDGFWAAIQQHQDIQRRDLLSWFGNLRLSMVSGFFNRMVERRLKRAADALVDAGVPVYRYVFEWEDFDSPWRELLGASHGLDVPFVFGNFQDDSAHVFRFAWSPRTQADRELIHRQMTVALGNFIRQSDPDPLGDDWPLWDERRQLRRVY